MFRKCYPVAILLLTVQSSHASGLCGFLNEVVSSASEKPPFGSVRYLDAPGAQCLVGSQKALFEAGFSRALKPSYKLFNDSWACIWQKAEIRKITANIPKIKSKMRSHDRYLSRINCRKYYNKERCGKRRSEYRYLKAELNNSQQKIEEEYQQVKTKARKFVHSIQSCTKANKIQGSWPLFNQDAKKEDILYWAISKAGVEILVVTSSTHATLTIEIARVRRQSR